MFAFYRKSGLLNAFPVTCLRLEVGLMHFLYMRTHRGEKGHRQRCRVPVMTASFGKTGALNSNVTSDIKPELIIWSELRMRSKNRHNGRKAASDGQNFCIVRNRRWIHFRWQIRDQNDIKVIHLLRMHRRPLSCLKHTASDTLRVRLNVSLFEVSSQIYSED